MKCFFNNIKAENNVYLIYGNFSINLENFSRDWYNCVRKIEKRLERRNRLWHGDATFVEKEPQQETV